MRRSRIMKTNVDKTTNAQASDAESEHAEPRAGAKPRGYQV